MKRSKSKKEKEKGNYFHPKLTDNTKKILRRMSTGKMEKSKTICSRSRKYDSRSPLRDQGNGQNMYLKRCSTNNSLLHKCENSLKFSSNNFYSQKKDKRVVFKYQGKENNLQEFNFSTEKSNKEKDGERGYFSSVKKCKNRNSRSLKKNNSSLNKRSGVPLLDEEVEFFNSHNSYTKSNLDDSTTPRFRKPTITAILKSPNPRKIEEQLLQSPCRYRRRRKKKKDSPILTKNNSKSRSNYLSRSRKNSADSKDCVYYLLLREKSKKRRESRPQSFNKFNSRPKDFDPKKSGYKFFHREREIKKEREIKERNQKRDHDHFLAQRRSKVSRKKAILEFESHNRNKSRKIKRYEEKDYYVSEVKVKPHEDELREKILKHSKLLF